jgi:hypothetical protein
VRKRVCINGVGTQVFCHAAHNAFACCDIAGETDDFFAGQSAQSDSNQM